MVSILDMKYVEKSRAESEEGRRGGGGQRSELRVEKRRRGLEAWAEMRFLK